MWKQAFDDATFAACGTFDCEGNKRLDRQQAEILIGVCTDPDLTWDAVDEALASGKPLYAPGHPISVRVDGIVARIEAENAEVARRKPAMMRLLRDAVRAEPKRRKPARTKLEMTRQALAEVYPGGIPELPNKLLVADAASRLPFKVSGDTILRAAGRK